MMREKAVMSLRPKPVVRNIVGLIKHQLWVEHGVSIRDVTAVHIRMQEDMERDVPGISDLDKHDERGLTKSMRNTVKHRKNCHYKNFMDTIRLRNKLGNNDKVYFVTSDTDEALRELRGFLGTRFFSPNLPLHTFCRNTNMSRSTECIQLALAEMFLLSKCHTFIYSSYSSFSEVINMLGTFDGGSFTGCVEERK